MDTGKPFDRDELVRRIRALHSNPEPSPDDIGPGIGDDEYIRELLNKFSRYADAFLIDLIAGCLRTHAPSDALSRLDHFISSRGDFTCGKGITPAGTTLLARVLATSGILSGRLAADGAVARLAYEIADPFTAQFRREYYLEYILTVSGDASIPSERAKALHRAHTVQLMRLCARNADPATPICDINAELSALADAVVETCLSIAHEELSERAGAGGKPHDLAVLGLGKLGGRELNVSSDIDLIYLYSDKGDSWGQYDAYRYHTMLAERLTRLLTEATELGALYRVDTRLRADGASGPLVRTPEDYLRYLEMRGEAWERQMLVKARLSAGSVEIGRSFLEAVVPFVYPASLSRSPNREIVELKTRIEARMVEDGSKKTHLKLVPGGVRDIEFIVQCLQLLTGGTHPGVRLSGTIPALDALAAIGAVSAVEHRTLADAYRLYRRVENALQWRELLPAFTLPEAGDELNRVAAFLAFGENADDPGSLLSGELGRARSAVRAIFDDVFSLGEGSSFAESVLHAARHPGDGDKTRRFMESHGFTERLERAKALSRLVFGEGGDLPGYDLHDSIARFTPKLMRTLGDLPDPGGVLERFTRIVSSYHSRHILFEMLEGNPSFFELILSITRMSVFMTELIERDPSLLDWLVEAGEILHTIDTGELRRELGKIGEVSDDGRFSRECLAVKNREKLRIAVRDITGIADTAETFRELSALASCIVTAATDRALKNMRKRHRAPREYGFSVIAAGRLGAGMMDFGSDLDLIYVYREPDSAAGFDAPRISIRTAQHLQSLITGGGGPDKVYDVDARLRPEGGNAVLAVSLAEYRRYFEHRASTWERLALVRSKALSGDRRLGKDVEEAVAAFVYGNPLDADEIGAVMAIRARMIDAAAQRYPGRRNVKSGAGGIADIDFVAQTYAVHYGSTKHSLRKRETPAILGALAEAGVIARHDAASLGELYAFLCDTEKAIRIGSGRSANIIPDSERETARISDCLGFKNVRRFRKRLDDVCSLTTELYDRLMKELLDRVSGGKTRK